MKSLNSLRFPTYVNFVTVNYVCGFSIETQVLLSKDLRYYFFAIFFSAEINELCLLCLPLPVSCSHVSDENIHLFVWKGKVSHIHIMLGMVRTSHIQITIFCLFCSRFDYFSCFSNNELNYASAKQFQLYLLLPVINNMNSTSLTYM